MCTQITHAQQHLHNPEIINNMFDVWVCKSNIYITILSVPLVNPCSDRTRLSLAVNWDGHQNDDRITTNHLDLKNEYDQNNVRISCIELTIRINQYWCFCRGSHFPFVRNLYPKFFTFFLPRKFNHLTGS